jgi:DnaJ family protein C protein 3
MGDINDLDDHEPVEVKKTEEPKKKKKVDEDGNEIKEPVEAYKLLGLEDKGFDATAEEIKKAFRKLSLQYHPDKVAANGLDPEEAEAQYKLIQEANEILTTPELKILFDSDVKNLVSPFPNPPLLS